jgi:hypothetical protein
MNVILHLQVLEKILLNLYDTFVNDILGHLNNCKIVHIGQKGHTSDSSKRSYQHLSINYSAALVHCKRYFHEIRLCNPVCDSYRNLFFHDFIVG